MLFPGNGGQVAVMAIIPPTATTTPGMVASLATAKPTNKSPDPAAGQHPVPDAGRRPLPLRPVRAGRGGEHDPDDDRDHVQPLDRGEQLLGEQPGHVRLSPR